MGTVGLVNQYLHTSLMSQVGHGAQIAANPIISRVIDKHSLGMGVIFNGIGHILYRHAETDAKFTVHTGIDINRHGTAKYQGIDYTFMNITGQNHFLSPFATGKDHCLHR